MGASTTINVCVYTNVCMCLIKCAYLNAYIVMFKIKFTQLICGFIIIL